ncbi:MAG: histidinol dehydrogenase [Gemmatimonadota bacterium]
MNGSEAYTGLRAWGPIEELDPGVRAALLDRAAASDGDTIDRVTELLSEVRRDGDRALREQTARFDAVTLDQIEIPRSSWTAAVDRLPTDVRTALERAARNIRTFHSAQRPETVVSEVEPGVRVERRSTPLQRVGVYAPGGTAAYPSSVLMGVVPAKACGVGEVVVCSPPGPDGTPSDTVLAACHISGADRLFAVGGAAAIGAMAFGTDSLPRVDTIVGPGNRWVTEAKRQVAGSVPIDGPAGPSEVLVLADESSDIGLVAAEVLAQAEHDPDAGCVVITTDPDAPIEIAREIARTAETAERAETIRTALRRSGAVLLARDLDDAIDFTEAYAPEHLSVLTREAATVADRIRNAGTVFVGPSASVAFGDYMTGANHVLPTSGRARAFSGLSSAHFYRSYTVQYVSAEGAARMSDDVATLAEAEGLPAHADAARLRGGRG